MALDNITPKYKTGPTIICVVMFKTSVPPQCIAPIKAPAIITRSPVFQTLSNHFLKSNFGSEFVKSLISFEFAASRMYVIVWKIINIPYPIAINIHKCDTSPFQNISVASPITAKSFSIYIHKKHPLTEFGPLLLLICFIKLSMLV